MATEDEIQRPLVKLMSQEPYSRFFMAPRVNRISEFTLEDEGKPFRADACYEICGGGYLFIEHDNAQTGLNNLVKYWKLIAEKKLVGPIFIIHIVDNKRPAASRLCKFIGDRFEKDQQNTKYYIREVSDWHNTEWKERLVEVLEEIIKGLANNGVESIR